MYICKYRSTHHLNERESSSSTGKNDFPQNTSHMLNLGIYKQTNKHLGSFYFLISDRFSEN